MDGCACTVTTIFPINGNGEYVGTISSSTFAVDVEISILHLDGRCYWRVVADAYDVDELFEIDQYLQSCEEPMLSVTIYAEDCIAELTITKHRLTSFQVPSENNCQPEIFCGQCQCVCDTLCYGFYPHPSSDAEYTAGELMWDEDLRCWTGDYSICLERDDYSGDCLLKAYDHEQTPADETIELEECDSINVRFTFPMGVLWVFCKKCQCNIWCCEGSPPRTIYITVSNMCSSVSFPLHLEHHRWDDDRWIWSQNDLYQEDFGCLIDHHGDVYCESLGPLQAALICTNSEGCLHWHLVLKAGWCQLERENFQIDCHPFFFTRTDVFPCECLDELEIVITE